MANVLFVESDPIALKAFSGIINRSPHTLTVAETVEKAWELILKEKFFHIVIIELKLQGASGKTLIQRMRTHPFLDKVPVLVYSRVTDRDQIRQVLLLDVQNYLIKPYDDQKLFNEINRATGVSWWADYFEKAEIVCDRLLLLEDQLNEKYQLIERSFKDIPLKASEFVNTHTVYLMKIAKMLEQAGFEALKNHVNEAIEVANKDDARKLQQTLDSLPIARKLLKERVRPGTHTIKNRESIDSSDADSKPKKTRSVERVATWEDVRQKLDELQGFPIVDSVAASFQMAAKDPDVDISILVHTIMTDPGLTAEVIYYNNKTTSTKGPDVDDPKLAIQYLGLSRIRALSSTLITIPEEDLTFRGFDWKQYWMFQVGSAILSEEIVKMLSLPFNGSVAYFNGLIHEIGKMLLCYFYPNAYENAIEYAHDTSIPLLETERHYFGCDHEQVGSYFTSIAKMPKTVEACTAHYRDPKQAPPEYREFVAVISLADFICKVYDIGYSGSRLPKGITTLATHPSWAILKPSLYEGFTVTKFERAMRERIQILKRELIGLAEKNESKR